MKKFLIVISVLFGFLPVASAGSIGLKVSGHFYCKTTDSVNGKELVAVAREYSGKRNFIEVAEVMEQGLLDSNYDGYVQIPNSISKGTILRSCILSLEKKYKNRSLENIYKDLKVEFKTSRGFLYSFAENQVYKPIFANNSLTFNEPEKHYFNTESKSLYNKASLLTTSFASCGYLAGELYYSGLLAYDCSKSLANVARQCSGPGALFNFACHVGIVDAGAVCGTFFTGNGWMTSASKLLTSAATAGGTGLACYMSMDYLLNDYVSVDYKNASSCKCTSVPKDFGEIPEYTKEYQEILDNPDNYAHDDEFGFELIPSL